MSASPIFQSMRRLACFAAIADAGSVKGGASRLGLSVPVVSTALAELEEELSVILAVRTTRKLELTRAGEEIYQHAQAMLSAADTALSTTTTDRVTSGQLRITVPVEMGSHWLPKYLLEFHRAFPGIELSVDADDSVVALHSSEYDIAIQANYQPPNATQDDRLVRSSIHLGTLGLMCVAAKKPRIRWQGSTAIMNSALIELKNRGDSLLAVDPRSTQTVHVRGRTTIHTNSHETALALARENLGVVLVMAVTAKAPLESNCLTRVFPSYNFGHLNIELKIRDSLPSPPARAFVNFIQSKMAG